MLSVGFEPAIPATKRPQIYALRPRGHWNQRFFLNISEFIIQSRLAS
jgi:hypothetical protein